MADKKIIFFELNEVPWRIIETYCGWHPDAHLTRLLPRCHQFETISEDVVLSPWVTWPTVHRGILDETHQIHHFGQDLSDLDQEYPPVWQILAKSGVKTAVFGSLHSYPMPDDVERYAFYMPDTFAAGSECFPADLSPFQAFNLSMARASMRNVSERLPWGQALKLLARLPNLGLKPATLLDTARQLLDERRNPWRKVRRRTYQSILAFDIFLKYLDRTRPDFVTFFTNHVASSMHRYWAATFPDDYEVFEYDEAWIARFRNEIDFTMSKFDHFLARLVAFVDRNRDYALWIVSSMGQAATTAEIIESQLYVTDLPRFMAAMGVGEGGWEQRPAMAPKVSVFLKNGADADRFRENLRNLEIEGAPLSFDEREKDFFSLVFGQKNLTSVSITLRGTPITMEALGLSNTRIEDLTGSNAYHIPAGSLLIYDPAADRVDATRTRIETIEITPAILQNFSITPPAYMRPAKPGTIGG